MNNISDILSAVATSTSLREAARKAGIPHSTLSRLIKKLEQKGKFRAFFNYPKLGLVPLLIIAEWTSIPSKNKIIEGTVSIREGYSLGLRALVITALVPFRLLDSYYLRRLNEWGLTPYVVVRGLEYLKWNPALAPVTHISRHIPSKYGINGSFFIPIYSELEKKILTENTPPSPIEPNVNVPDPYDLALLFNFWRHSPWEPKKIPKYAIKDGLKNINAKRISDHWRKHLLPYWLYNTYISYFRMLEVPLRVLIFTGRSIYGVARALASIPYTYFSVIDIDRVAIVMQAPCSLYIDFYKLLSTFDVSVEYDLLLAPSLVRWDPRLWRFVRKRGKRWEWCEPKLVEVKVKRRRV